MENLSWFPVEEALRLDLALVTLEVLGQFRSWLLQGPDERAARQQTPVFMSRQWSME